MFLVPGLEDNSMKRKQINRRSFVRGSASMLGGLLAAPWIVPATVLGRNGAVAPSDKIHVGCIGTGSHGIHWNLRATWSNPMRT